MVSSEQIPSAVILFLSLAPAAASFRLCVPDVSWWDVSHLIAPFAEAS